MLGVQNAEMKCCTLDRLTESTSGRAVRPRRPLRDDTVDRTRLHAGFVVVQWHSALHIYQHLSSHHHIIAVCPSVTHAAGKSDDVTRKRPTGLLNTTVYNSTEACNQPGWVESLRPLRGLFKDFTVINVYCNYGPTAYHCYVFPLQSA